MSEKIRYGFSSDGLYELNGRYIYFSWIKTSGVIDLENRTLKYGSEKYPVTLTRTFRASMNDIIQYFSSIEKDKNFKNYMVQWFRKKEEDFKTFNE
jgi:hypothetical protein